MRCMVCGRFGVKTEVIRVGTRETADVCVDVADCKAAAEARKAARAAGK